jgi:hypothetical protein
VKTKIRQQLNRSKRRIERRLDKRNVQGCERPMFTASNIEYEISGRDRGIAHGGIGAMHTLTRRLGLIDAIDRYLVVFEILHLPYHESDHVLNFAYNSLCGGTCLEDIELRRNDEAFLDALGARRIPDPTTAGDFCRRFDAGKIRALQDMRLKELNFSWTQVSDLSPLKNMPLTTLVCSTTRVSDLSPLKDMPLTFLNCNYNDVSDLSSLKGMKLTTLMCGSTKAADLSPLQGMKLTKLLFSQTQVINCDFNAERDGPILRSITTLKTINGKSAKEFLK